MTTYCEDCDHITERGVNLLRVVVDPLGRVQGVQAGQTKSPQSEGTLVTPTLCESCDNVVHETVKRSPTQWLCIKFPRLEGAGFVAPKTWTDMEPYMRCSGINGGACPMFVARRVPKKEAA